MSPSQASKARAQPSNIYVKYWAADDFFSTTPGFGHQIDIAFKIVLSVWGGLNYFFLFSFLCLIWHVIERYG